MKMKDKRSPLRTLLKTDIKNGLVRIEKTEIIGADNKEYDL